MTSATLALQDSATMTRRQLRRLLRYPALTLQLAVLPVVFLLLFVYVFGGTLGDGLGTGGGGRAAYVEYVVPGILLMTVATGIQGTAITVAMDMTQGIVSRFRTMAIARGSVLTAHVIGTLVQTFFSLAAVLAVGLLVGFRPSASPPEWLAAVGVLLLITFALTWLSVALGLVSKTVEGASSLPQPLVFLPFLGSGFVPTESMPWLLRVIAEHQPFTPWTETVRGLLTGGPVADSIVPTLAWCAVVGIGGWAWSRRLFSRDPAS